MQNWPALVIGAGPAGLMAAEVLAQAGHAVLLAEAKPSPARKFLMAGKSGLNLTKDEPLSAFLHHYTPQGWLDPMLATFGPVEVMDWARALGQEVFTGTSGRVFPVAMKASPLLRAWLARGRELGIDLRSRWRWIGLKDGVFSFETPTGLQHIRPEVCVLALGGASWARLGSTGDWASLLTNASVEVARWQPANMGLAVSWSPHMTRHFGQPIKGAALRAGELHSRGEFVISQSGLEGGGIYSLSRALREGATLEIDLAPDLELAELERRLTRMRKGESLTNRLRKLGLSSIAIALVQEWGKRESISRDIKYLKAVYRGPRPLDEAISVAGGITRDSLSAGLELNALPGVFAAGEMLDWEAPTGGYLLTGCLATGLWAGRSALARLSGQG